MENRALTRGDIMSVLIKLALPIMGTSFIQMAYNMIDMIWIGSVGTKAVAAVGTAGFFTWLSMGLIRIPNTGAAVGVAQSIGANDEEASRKYIGNTVQMSVLMGLGFSIFVLMFKSQFIDCFRLGDHQVSTMAVSYLTVIGFGMIFTFLNPVLTSIFTGYGDSKTPFMVNTVGLIINIVLDPVLIFGLGGFPELGVAGAAIATVFSQGVVTLVFIYYIKFKGKLLPKVKFFIGFHWSYIKTIFKLGFPVGVQSGIFTIIAIFLARIIADYGAAAIAVQKVGTQIEAISWMSAHGFATALSAFVGQNYGANEYDRVKEGTKKALTIMIGLGIVTSLAFIIIPRQIFWIFIREEETLRMGAEYLRILGVSQLFMCIEITLAGTFNGLGRTMTPSVVSMIFTAARIPLALFFAETLGMGLNGIWWSISFSSVLKGIILITSFALLQYRNPTYKMKKATLV